jgi:hypothetical protein
MSPFTKEVPPTHSEKNDLVTRRMTRMPSTINQGVGICDVVGATNTVDQSPIDERPILFSLKGITGFPRKKQWQFGNDRIKNSGISGTLELVYEFGTGEVLRTSNGQNPYFNLIRTVIQAPGRTIRD